MQIEDVQSFLWVADAGSLSAAARTHGVAKATLSLRLARLEAEIGGPLLTRSRTGVMLTEAGHGLLPHAQQLEQVHQRAMDAAMGMAPVPAGHLRIGVTEQLATNLATPMALQFAESTPGVSIEIQVLPTERLLSPRAELDCMICESLPSLEEGSTLVARGFYRYRRHLYAAPTYLERRGTPHAPADLRGHELIGARAGSRGSQWHIANGDRHVVVETSGHFSTNDEWVVKVCLLQGRGIGLLPDFFALEHLAGGELVEILPQWGTEPASVTVLHQAHRFQNPNIRAFTDFLSRRFKGFYSYPYRQQDVMSTGRPPKG